MKIFHMYDEGHECDDIYCANIGVLYRKVKQLVEELTARDLGFLWNRDGYYSYFNQSMLYDELSDLSELTEEFLIRYFEHSTWLALEFHQLGDDPNRIKIVWMIKLVDVEE